MSNNGFFEEVASHLDKESFVEIEVTQYHKDTYGADGDIRVTTSSGSFGAHNVWLDRKASKRLRKALKRAEKFLES